MSRFRRFSISFEDEAHLKTIWARSFSSPILAAILFIIICIAVLLGAILVMVTPLQRLLPGYLKDDQRTETQLQILRADSINEVIARNQAWMDNVLRITDTNRNPDSDSLNYTLRTARYNPDSLPDATPIESRFVVAMDEREKFNISVLAPLDAEGMIFSPVTPNAIFSPESIELTTGTILLPDDAPIQAIADGNVVATFLSPSANGYSVVIQHSRGFTSLISHLGPPLVNSGDMVNAGQAIAFPPKFDAKGRRWVNIRIWHNATPIIPAEILSTLL